MRIEKITKEENPNAISRRADRSAGYKGYKGFVDVGVTGGDYGSVDVTTTHGCQIIPDYLFVGGGLGIQTFPSYDNGSEGTLTALPLYVNVRSNFLKSKVSPFADFKLGYAGLTGDVDSFEDGGVYVSTAIVVRFRFTRKFGLNVITGYTYQEASARYYDYGSGTYYYTSKENIGGFHLKVGLEF